MPTCSDILLGLAGDEEEPWWFPGNSNCMGDTFTLTQMGDHRGQGRGARRSSEERVEETRTFGASRGSDSQYQTGHKEEKIIRATQVG